MSLPRRVIDDLTALSDALDDPAVNLPAAVSVLAGHLRVAVPSFIGLTVMVHVADCPVVISGGDVGEAAAVQGSLVLSLVPLGAATTTGSIAFYSGIPGVFLTLADDVRWIFNLSARPFLDGYTGGSV